MTNNTTATYLLEKGSLETNIFWHVKTIAEVDRQQEVRRTRLEELRTALHRLEQDYYNN